MPLIPKDVSRDPLMLYRARAKTVLPLVPCPAAIILPSCCSTQDKICESCVGVTSVVTMPLVPKIVSSDPLLLYRARVKTELPPLFPYPAAIYHLVAAHRN